MSMFSLQFDSEAEDGADEAMDQPIVFGVEQDAVIETLVDGYMQCARALAELSLRPRLRGLMIDEVHLAGCTGGDTVCGE